MAHKLFIALNALASIAGLIAFWTLLIAAVAYVVLIVVSKLPLVGKRGRAK